MNVISPDLFLECDAPTPRLRYAAQLLFDRLLGLKVELGHPNPNWKGSILGYGSQRPQQPYIPNDGLLYEEDIREMSPEFSQKPSPRLFPSPDKSRQAYPADILSAVFYLASGYEKYIWSHYDSHGRYAAQHYPSSAWGLENRPLLHIMARDFGEWLKGQFPNLIINPPAPRPAELTIDIDFPWKYQHKGLLVNMAALVRDAVFNPAQVKARLSVLMGKKDPYDTYDHIFRLGPPEQTRFFFLVDRHSEYDSRYTYRNKKYRQLIKRIYARGYPVGIHPSYSSFLNGNRIMNETQALSEIIAAPVRHSRMHFLRYRLPDTYRHLLEAGIRNDYSQADPSLGGFANGLAIPHPWFDLEENKVTDLTLHPAQIMDRTLVSYQNLAPKDADERFASLLQATAEYDGQFRIILHNDTLSDCDDWQGWKNHFEKYIRQALMG